MHGVGCEGNHQASPRMDAKRKMVMEGRVAIFPDVTTPSIVRHHQRASVQAVAELRWIDVRVVKDRQVMAGVTMSWHSVSVSGNHDVSRHFERAAQAIAECLLDGRKEHQGYRLEPPIDSSLACVLPQQRNVIVVRRSEMHLLKARNPGHCEHFTSRARKFIVDARWRLQINASSYARPEVGD